jgi:hypothetical protein
VNTISNLSYRSRVAHLTAVWAISVSQPVFSFMEANPEFLAVRGSTRSEVVAFAALLAFGPPLLALAAERLVSLLSPAAGGVLHVALVGLFFLPLCLEVVKDMGLDAAVAVVAATTMVVVVLLNYVRWSPVRSFFGFLVILPVIGFVAFVAWIPVVKDDVAGAAIKVPSKTPVVMLVFDEFPVSSLMTPAGTIDAVRYPNFGRLAAESTWYSRATTVHEHTTGAVPAILTGTVPEGGDLPLLSDHPENLFTLLGESYAMDVRETSTFLCPARYCPRDRKPLTQRLEELFSDVRIAYLHRILPEAYSEGLPPLGDRWGGFGARDELLVARSRLQVDLLLADLKHTDETLANFDRFVSGFSSGRSRPTLHFHHVLLPHTPFRFLPSGREYGNSAAIDGLSDSWNRWDPDPWLEQQGYQRHLLQVGFVDRLMGQFLRNLRRSGLYDRALVVVAADHGASFSTGVRRNVTPENVADVARVPVFVKYPGQRGGRVDGRAVRTVDILPTIAEVLDVQIPWQVEGTSLLNRDHELSDVVVSHRDGTVLSTPVVEVNRLMSETLRRKAAMFGQGSDSLYAIGEHTELLGRNVNELPVRTSSETRVSFDGEDLFANVRTSDPFVTTRITGTIAGTTIDRKTELAVAVNGRVAGLTRTFVVNGRQRFGALVPEESFRDGSNRVALFAIGRLGGAMRLLLLGESNAEQRFELDIANGRIVLPDEGVALIERERIAGEVETWGLESGTMRLRGWAADFRDRELVDHVLVFAGRRLLYAGETTEARWLPQNMESDDMRGVGFDIGLPERSLRSSRVRVFAVRGTKATELSLPLGFPKR